MRKCAKTNAQRHTGEAGNNPAFPARWLYDLCRALPGDEFLFVTVASRIDDTACPVGLAASPQGLTVATTARTTRFCRTQDFFRLRLKATPDLRPPSLQRGRNQHRSSRVVKRSRGSAQSTAPPCSRHPRRRCPRPPQPGPRFVTTYDRPFRGPGCFACTAKPNFGKVECFCSTGLTRVRNSQVLSDFRVCGATKILMPSLVL